MERLPSNEGYWKWGVLATTVVVLECIGQDSLTSHARRALEHPIGRIAIPALIGVTALHLLDRCPVEIDPYQQIANLVDRLHGD